MESNKPNLYLIKGGIGKCVLFTAMISKLAARDNNQIVVGSGYPGVFLTNPKVYGTLKGMTPEIITPVADKFADIIFREPYISNYCKGDRHILDEWARLYDIEPFENGGYHARPDLGLNETFLKQSDELKDKIGKKFFIVQWTGGQPPNHFRNNNKYPENYLNNARNVKNYRDIMLQLAEAFPEHMFLVYALPNEPVEMPESIRSRIVRAKVHALTYAAALKHSDGFIALDSSLQHFGAAEQINKKGVVLWGQKTTPETIGYSFHTNLNSTATGEVVVPVVDVVDALMKIVASK